MPAARLAATLSVALAAVALAAGPAPASMVWGAGTSPAAPADAASGYLPSTGFSVSCASAGECTSVGRYVDHRRTLQGWLMTKSAGTWAPGVAATLPADAAMNPDVRLRSVSCASAGNCTAVGIYLDGASHWQGLLLTQAAGVWAAGTKPALPADAAANTYVDLRSVSCSSAGNCAAVGTYATNASTTQGLLLTQSAGTWGTGTAAALPSDASPAQDVVLNSVSCASAGNCAAVGHYVAYDPTADKSSTQGLLLTESSGVWSPDRRVNLPSGAADPKVTMNAVSCAAVGNCAAVGHYVSSSNDTRGVLVDQLSGVWQDGVDAALPAGAAADAKVDLGSVSCPAADECTAVGSFADGSGTQGLLVSKSAATWNAGTKAVLPAAAATDPKVALGSVSCAAASQCTAAGSYADGSGRVQGLLLTQSSGAWATGATAGLPANASADAPAVALRSVSCSAAGDCTAGGGFADTSRAEQALVVTQSAGTWATGISPPPPANAGKIASADLRSVSCVSASDCAAAGSYLNASGQQGMLLTKSSGVWGTPASVTPPPGAASNPLMMLGSVSCVSADSCAAVGAYVDASSNPQAVLLSRSAGVWAAGVKATMPAGAATNANVLVMSVACGAPGDCAAVGTYVDGAGATQGVLLSQAAGVWAPGVKAALPADAAANPKVALTSVSCPAAGTCAAVGSYVDNTGNTHGLLLDRIAGVWGPGSAPALPAHAMPSQISVLTSVSCPSAGACTAVGIYYDDAPGLPGFAVSQTSSGVWGTGTKTTLPADAPSVENVFLGSAACVSLGTCAAVSCPSAGSCAAVGNFRDLSATERPLVMNATAGAWAPGAEATLPAGGSMIASAGLSAVSCGSPGVCASVGSFRDGSGAMRGLLLGQDGDVWSAGVAATLPAGAAADPTAQLRSVSCVTGGCTAVGGYGDASGQVLSLVVEGVRHTEAPSGPDGTTTTPAPDGGGTLSPAPAATSPAPAATSPAPGAPGAATVGAARVAGTTASIRVRCAGATACKLKLTLSVVEMLRRGRLVGVTAARPKIIKKRVVVGRTSVTVAPGATKTVRLSLNRTGKRLLVKHSPLRVRLAVTSAGKTVATTKVRFVRPAKKHRAGRR